MDFLSKWWHELRRRNKVGKVMIVASMTDIPKSIDAKVYLVRQGTFDKRIVFNCPCGCQRRIDLNLVATQRPSWHITVRKNKLSLKPSVWLTADPCQSHFFINDSRIDWVGRAVGGRY